MVYFLPSSVPSPHLVSVHELVLTQHLVNAWYGSSDPSPNNNIII